MGGQLKTGIAFCCKNSYIEGILYMKNNMKPFTLILLIFCPIVLFGQIMNGDFDEWRPAFSDKELPKHFFFSSTIHHGTVERKIQYEGYKNVIKFNPEKYEVGMGQFAGLGNLNAAEKGTVQIVMKMYSPTNQARVKIGHESYLPKEEVLTNSVVIIERNTDGFEDIKLCDIHPDTDTLYFYVSIGGNYVDGQRVDDTVVWIDRIYIKPKETIRKPAPTILKSGKGYRVKYSLEEDYEYSIYSMDGKYMKGGELSMEHELTVSPQGIYVLILRNTKTQEYHTYKLVFLE